MNRPRQRICIADIGRVVTGKTPPTKQPELYGTSYPFITPTDIGDDSRNVQPARFISELGRKRHSSAMLPPNAVCFTCIASIGKICMTKQLSLTNQQINSVIVDESKHDPRYVFYLLITETERIKAVAGGVATPIINKTAFSEMEMEVHPLTIQRKIAAILSAYDDLIENNLRRIKILEEMAQNLYREWFVKFRFPGHEKTRFVDSPLGQIPEGWEVKGAMENKNWSFIHQSIGPYEGIKRYYATADIDGIAITGNGIEYIYSKKPSRAQKQPLLNSVWFARMQDTYKVLAVAKPNATLTTNSMLSSGFAGFKAPDEDSFAFLFLTIKSNEFHSEKDRYCTGATQRSLTNDGLSRILTVSPPREIVQQFGRVAMSFIEMILALQQRNLTLRRTRDLLLPKLISGEVDVSKLDITVPEEAV